MLQEETSPDHHLTILSPRGGFAAQIRARSKDFFFLPLLFTEKGAACSILRRHMPLDGR